MSNVAGAVALLLCCAVSCSGKTPDHATGRAPDGGYSRAADASDEDSGAAGASTPEKRDAGTQPEVVSQYEACRRYVAYYCERWLGCGMSTLQYASACFQAADACPDLIFSPGSTRTVDNVMTCAKAWLDHPCDEVLHERAPKCGATPGTRDNGESCITTTQCKSARCTGDIARMACGKCIEQAASGGACGADIVCPRDETCMDGKCMPRPLATPGQPTIFYAPGQACMHSNADNYGGCAFGAECDERPGLAGDHCYDLPAPGERCYKAYPHVCWGEGNCDGHTCAPVYACTDALRKCEAGQVCVCSEPDCQWRACAQLRQEGQTCEPPVVPCGDRLECVQGVCKRANLPSRFDQVCK